MGDTLGPRLPFWLDVVTESDEVAVVVPCGLSILAVFSQPCTVVVVIHVQHDAPSGSELVMELRPLQL